MSASTSRPVDEPDDLAQAIDVAERYFLTQQSKVAIGQALGISRFKVARILQECLDSGLVRITIHPRSGPHTDVADQLKALYDLEHVLVVDGGTAGQEHSLREQLGRAAAGLLERLVTDQDVLGVGWGRSIKAIADAVTSLPSIPIVQLGGMAGSPGENSMELVRRLAAVSHGSAYPLYAPLLVPDAATAAGLRKQAGIAETFARHDEITVGVIAVGSWDPPNSQLRSAFSTAARDELTAQGVRAEVCGVLLDGDGRAVAPQVRERMISIDGDQLRKIPTVVAVAGGLSKVGAIHSVLVGRYATSLVTDVAVARALIDGARTRGVTPLSLQ